MAAWDLAEMPGIELLQSIRADAALARVKVMLFADKATKSQILQAAESGVTDFFIKPFNQMLIAAKLERWLG